MPVSQLDYPILDDSNASGTEYGRTTLIEIPFAGMNALHYRDHLIGHVGAVVRQPAEGPFYPSLMSAPAVVP